MAYLVVSSIETTACVAEEKKAIIVVFNRALNPSNELCAQILSATLEHAFSKAGRIVSKRRQRLIANHVDSISLIDGITKTTVWGNEQKDPGVEQKWKEKALRFVGGLMVEVH